MTSSHTSPLYCKRILRTVQSHAKSCCLIWLSFVTGVGINLTPLASKFIWLSVNCLFERVFDVFYSPLIALCFFFCECFYVSICALFDILFPFSPCLRLRCSGNVLVYFSTFFFSFLAILQTFHCTGESYPVRLLAIMFTFVASAVWLDSDCSTLLFLVII